MAHPSFLFFAPYGDLSNCFKFTLAAQIRNILRI